MKGRAPRPVGIALAVGIVALLLSCLRLAFSPEGFFRSWLPACLFWIGIPLGSLAWLMIHRLTGGGWGVFARPVLAAGAGVLPVNLLLFLPLAFGLGHLYIWAGPERTAELAWGKALWLRPGFFLAREALVFLLWLGWAWISGIFERGRDRPGEGAAALGLVVYGLTVTVFAVDWIMALEPRWSSANIGFLAAVSPLLMALAFGTGALCLLAPERISPSSAARFGDLGGLLLAFVLLWSYLAFEQYLTIWSENLPDQAIWYVRRNAGGWRGWSWAVAAVAGALPFGLLLSRELKRDPQRLVLAAGLVLAGGLLDTYWQVMPGFYPTPGALSPLDGLPFLGIGGLWIAAYLWRLPRCLARYGTEDISLGRE